VIQVAVVAAVPALRAGLRAMLEADREIRVVAEAASPAALRLRPGVEVILIAVDPSLAPLRNLGPPLGEAPPILFLVESADALDPLLLSALPVYGVLALEAPGEALRAAVRALREGLIVLSPAFHPAPSPRGGLPGYGEAETPTEPLTPREIEVLWGLAQGLANKEIAARLGISEHTVKFHLSAIYRKLGAANRAEAVRIGLRQGWIPL